MRERVINLVNSKSTAFWLGTFHSICNKMLRRNAEVVGCQFTIIDTLDQIKLIKNMKRKI